MDETCLSRELSLMQNQSKGYMKALVRVPKTVGDLFIRMCITTSLMISVFPGNLADEISRYR